MASRAGSSGPWAASGRLVAGLRLVSLTVRRSRGGGELQAAPGAGPDVPLARIRCSLRAWAFIPETGPMQVQGQRSDCGRLPGPARLECQSPPMPATALSKQVWGMGLCPPAKPFGMGGSTFALQRHPREAVPRAGTGQAAQISHLVAQMDPHLPSTSAVTTASAPTRQTLSPPQYQPLPGHHATQPIHPSAARLGLPRTGTDEMRSSPSVPAVPSL